MRNKAYVPLRVAKDRLGLCGNTLRKYADEGKIDVIKNDAGQRLFNVESYIGSAGKSTVVCYARVSSRHQKDDLARQRRCLLSVYPEAELIDDIGSGLNFKRKGLISLLDRILRGDKLTVVVAHRDRLARFGFELIEYMVKSNGGSIVVLDETVHSPAEELTADLLSIITVFGARVNGLRKYRDKIKEDPSLAEQGTTKESESLA